MRILQATLNTSGAIIAAAICFAPYAARAETLETVLSNTYLGNPEINAERAKLRAVDEGVPQARAGYRPKVSFDANITGTHTKSSPPSLNQGPLGNGRSSSSGYSFKAVQPIFRGLRTINAIREADAMVYAGREDLRFVEQNVFLKATTAYVDVIRDRAILRLRRNNVKVLAEQQRATKDRFQVGEVTKTDVAQARARYAGSVSKLNFAKAAVKTSRAIFEQIVGHNPGKLRTPRSISRYLPRSLDAALNRGMSEHPSILGSTYREHAAVHAVKRIRGELLPEVNLEGSYAKSFLPANGRKSTSGTATIRGTLRVPLYQGGAVYSKIRQARQIVLQRQQDLLSARNKVRAEVIASWGQLSSIKDKLSADRTQVSANNTALEGVRGEEKVGQRTILDVLDAQQELLDSKVILAVTKRDLALARYNLLAASGRLSTIELGLAVEGYAPEANFNHVDRKWFGARVDGYQDRFEHEALVRDRYFPASYK